LALPPDNHHLISCNMTQSRLQGGRTTISMPNIPKQEGCIELSTADSVNLILASIGYEELARAHILNTEDEKFKACWAR